MSSTPNLSSTSRHDNSRIFKFSNSCHNRCRKTKSNELKSKFQFRYVIQKFQALNDLYLYSHVINAPHLRNNVVFSSYCIGLWGSMNLKTNILNLSAFIFFNNKYQEILFELWMHKTECQIHNCGLKVLSNQNSLSNSYVSLFETELLSIGVSL